LTADRPALATFPSTCCIALMPLSTTETSGWFHSHCNAQSAGERFVGALSHSAWTGWGGFTNRPPSSGSMITTAIPLVAAYCKPFVPAWFSMSM
jgi:hypothetical protein